MACLASLCLAGTSWARAAPKVMEKNLVVETADGSAEAARFYPVGKGRWPAVLFWPDAIGLPASYRDRVRRFAAKGFVVLTPNTFYRSTRLSDAADRSDEHTSEIQSLMRSSYAVYSLKKKTI